MRDEEPLFDIHGVVVSSSHTIRDPSDGIWRHGKDVKAARLSRRSDLMLYNLITETHRVQVRIPNHRQGSTMNDELDATDFMERDDRQEDLELNLWILNQAQGVQSGVITAEKQAL